MAGLCQIRPDLAGKNEVLPASGRQTLITRIMELFVGIRLKPFLYGAGNGYLLENDGKGNFTNVTFRLPRIARMLYDPRYVKDVDGDGDKDMILAGD